ncbi:MAG: transporter [Desulfobulbus sp.]
MKKFLFVLFLAVFFGGTTASADEVKTKKAFKKNIRSDEIRCVGPVNMSHGLVIPKGKYQLCLQYNYAHKDDLYKGRDKKTGNYVGKYDQVDHVANLIFKLGLFENFETRLIVPFINRELKRKSGNPPENTNITDNSGLGDIKVIGRYSLLSERKGDWLSMAIGGGVKLPTGDTDKKNVAPFSTNYEYMGPGFQLGTGSWDPIFELGITKFSGPSRYDFHTMYTIGTKGSHGSRKGDTFKCDLGYGYALNKHFDVELELNSVYQKAHRHDNKSTVDTGGHTIYLTPGMHWKINRELHLSMGVPIVIYRDINGKSRTPDWKSQYGLSEDYRFVTKIVYNF